MAIRIKVIGKGGVEKILDKKETIKIGSLIINTEIAKVAFLGYIKFTYKGLQFVRHDE